ncbi:MAG: histidine kinase [Colwellia sp.]|nr:histidine kinase [Colwellia sp.]
MKQKPVQFSIITFALLCLFTFTNKAFADVQINERIFQVGNNIQWATKAFDDNHWTPLNNGLPIIEHNYWVRIHVEVKENSSIEQQAIFTSILGAYDIFWDDIKLASNGVWGESAEQEVPGSINFATPIPEKLWTLGKHVISFRISNFYSPKRLRSHYFNIRISSHQATSENYLRSNIFPLIILGGIILIGGFFLLLHFLYSKKNTYALFSSLCFLIASLLIVEVWRPLLGYSYDWHIYRLYCVGALTFLIALLLPIFLILHLEITHKKLFFLIIITALMSVLLFAEGFDNISGYLTQISLVISSIVAAWAIHLRKPEAGNAFFSVISVLLISVYFSDTFQDRYFFPSFGLIIITVLVSLINQLSHVQQQRNRAQLLSAQLEISLLKKNIQPHFILNTLTSIEQWIVESPNSAIEFIDALAEEFKLLNEISSKQLISINDELKLCQAHLKIMGFRHDLQFTLDTKNIPNELMLPPALLHTLLENCFTHNRYTRSPTTFVLTCVDQGSSFKLIMKSPMSSNSSNSSLDTGTGLKYIESSLTENFHDNWSMSSGIMNARWVTEIELPKNPH